MSRPSMYCTWDGESRTMPTPKVAIVVSAQNPVKRKAKPILQATIQSSHQKKRTAHALRPPPKQQPLRIQVTDPLRPTVRKRFGESRERKTKPESALGRPNRSAVITKLDVADQAPLATVGLYA
jgi:hypothetical protein